jgi:hypothetical protein
MRAHTVSPGGKRRLWEKAPLVWFVGVVKPERYAQLYFGSNFNE